MNGIALKMLLGDRLKYVSLIVVRVYVDLPASIDPVGLTKQTGSFIRDTAQADLCVMDPAGPVLSRPSAARPTVLQQVRNVTT